MRRESGETERWALVVDPDDRDRHLLTEALEAEGWQVQGARTASAGKAHLASGKFDLLLTELFLSSSDGLSLLRACRGGHPTVSMILVSAGATARDVKAAEAAGAADVLCKPWTPRDLAASLDRLQSPTGLRAQFDELSLVDVLQICHQLGRSTTVVVPGRGRVWFERGEVVHAEAGLRTGQAALSKLLQVEGGAVRLDPVAPVAERTVQLPFTRLMLAVLTALDEASVDGPSPSRADAFDDAHFEDDDPFDEVSFDAAFAPFESDGLAAPPPPASSALAAPAPPAPAVAVEPPTPDPASLPLGRHRPTPGPRMAYAPMQAAVEINAPPEAVLVFDAPTNHSGRRIRTLADLSPIRSHWPLAAAIALTLAAAGAWVALRGPAAAVAADSPDSAPRATQDGP